MDPPLATDPAANPSGPHPELPDLRICGVA
jgi:hypothetical protein